MRRSLLNKLILSKSLRQALVLITMLLLPTTAWGQDPTITVAGHTPDPTTGVISGTNITDGTVTFDSSTSTLTLDNARVNGTVSTSLTTLRVHLKGHSIFNVTTDGTFTYLFNGATNLYYSAENFGDVLEGLGTTDDYKLWVSNVIESYDGSVDIWENTYTNINNKCYCKLSKPYLFVGDNEEVDKSNYNSDTRFSFDAANSSLTFSATPNSSNNNAFLVKSNIANLTVNITDNIIYGLDNSTTTGKAFVYTGTEANSALNLIIAEGKSLKIQWSGSSGDRGWINDGFSKMNISTDLSTMESSGVYAQEIQASELYYLFISNVELYDLSVAGISVNSINAGNILNDEINNISVSFTPANSTLTLNNASITVNGKNAIESGLDNLTVYLKGDQNDIKYQGSNDVAFLGTKSGAKVTFATDATSPGKLTGQGSAEKMFDNITPAYQGLSYNRDGDSFMISATDYGISIGGVAVTSANAGNILGGDNDGKVSFTPAKEADNTPATLKLTGATISGGIYTTLKDLTIDVTNTNTITNTISSNSNGICSNNNSGTLTFSAADGGSLEITSTAAAIRGFSALGGKTIETHTPNDLFNDAGYYRLRDLERGDSTGVKWVKVSAAVTTTYPLWIAGTQVTNSNASKVLGNETVAFDGVDKLTLSGASIDCSTGDYRYPVVSSIKDLKVYLYGQYASTFKISSDSYQAFKYVGAETGATLTFSTVDPTDFENLGMLEIYGISSLDYVASGYAVKGLVGETSTAIANWKEDTSSTPDRSVSGWKYLVNTGSEPFVKLSYREVYDLWISYSRYCSDNLTLTGETFNPTTSTLTFNGISGSSYQIYSGLDDLTIKIGSETQLKAITFGAPNDETIGATSGKLTIKKNETSSATVNKLTLANADTDGGVISGFSSVTIEEPMGVKSPSPFTTWEGTHNAVISDEIFYDLWVGGTQVSSGNANDVTNTIPTSSTAKVVFNVENSTLTLNDGTSIEITKEGGSAVLSGLENLTVKFDGSVYASKGTGVSSFYGFKAQEGKTCNITFTKGENGSFSMGSGIDNATSVISGFNKVTYNNGLVSYLDDGYFWMEDKVLNILFDVDTDDNQNPQAISITLSPDLNLVSHKIAYTIDYVDENIVDIPETEYTESIALENIIAGPCTVTAYLIDNNETKSNITKGYYFAYKESEIIIGNGTIVDLKDYLLPAMPEEGQCLNSTEGTGSNYISFREDDYAIIGKADGTAIVNSFIDGENITVFNQMLESEDYALKISVTVKDVIGENTFSSGQNYGTFFNTTEAYNVPEGLQAYIITNVDEEKGTIEMTQTSVLPPNTPVLIYRTSTTGTPNYVFTKASNVEPATTKLKYTTTEKSADESSKLYVLYNGQFVKVTAGTKILANHCYLDLGGTSAGTRGFYNIGDGEGTTAIREVIYEGVNSEKLASGEWFDLQGRRLNVKPNKSGLYILNGRKVVIK